jgi:DNA-binding response OmpR family regulator
LVKILLVENEEDIRELSGIILSNEGHDVTLAKDGNEALDWMRDNDYELVVLDVMMPNKNGLEVIQEMKESKRLRNVPIIVFSALGPGTRNMEKEMNMVNDYIEKPFTKDEFLSKVEKVLNKNK